MKTSEQQRMQRQLADSVRVTHGRSAPHFLSETMIEELRYAAACRLVLDQALEKYGPAQELIRAALGK